MNTLDPVQYGLNKRTKLEQLDEHHIGIVKLVKSRIIRKDAEKIIESANKIKALNNDKVSLVCTKNICSKSIQLLDDNNIKITFRDL